MKINKQFYFAIRSVSPNHTIGAGFYNKARRRTQKIDKYARNLHSHIPLLCIAQSQLNT
jgi:hypothetical protein